MQVFISLGGPTIRCDIDSKSIVIFPDKSSKQDVDLVLHSNPDEAPADKTISWPGEYDIGGIAIRGIGHQEGKMVSFVIETPQARCAFPVTPLHQWTDYELEQMGNIDVLVIPADDVKLVQKLVDEIDPRLNAGIRITTQGQGGQLRSGR